MTGAGMAVNVFVYGPLMLREVIGAVAGCEPVRRSGELHGYRQLRLLEQSQAGLIPFPDSATEGVLYMGVEEAILRRMDEFQGELFQRGEVNIQTDDGEWVEAETHLFRLRERKRLSAKPWDEDEFRKKHLKKALAGLRRERGAGGA